MEQTNEALKKAIENLRGKHIKSMLSRLEELGVVSPALRKIVLDEVNDLTRDILREIGFIVED